MLSPAAWQKAITQQGFDVTLDPDFDPVTFSGFLPARHNGHDAGVRGSFGQSSPRTSTQARVRRRRPGSTSASRSSLTRTWRSWCPQRSAPRPWQLRSRVCFGITRPVRATAVALPSSGLAHSNVRSPSSDDRRWRVGGDHAAGGLVATCPSSFNVSRPFGASAGGNIAVMFWRASLVAVLALSGCGASLTGSEGNPPLCIFDSSQGCVQLGDLAGHVVAGETHPARWRATAPHTAGARTSPASRRRRRHVRSAGCRQRRDLRRPTRWHDRLLGHRTLRTTHGRLAAQRKVPASVGEPESGRGPDACALRTHGQILCWQDCSEGQCQPPRRPFKQVSTVRASPAACARAARSPAGAATTTGRPRPLRHVVQIAAAIFTTAPCGPIARGLLGRRSRRLGAPTRRHVQPGGDGRLLLGWRPDRRHARRLGAGDWATYRRLPRAPSSRPAGGKHACGLRTEGRSPAGVTTKTASRPRLPARRPDGPAVIVPARERNQSTARGIA